MPAWSWNIDTGLVECNEHFNNFFNAKASNLMEFLPLISEDGGEYFLSLAGKSIQNREPFFTEVMLQTAKGKQKGFIWGCPEIMPEGKACMKVAGVIHPNEASQRPDTLEHRLLDQKAELQGLLDSIRSPIWYLDTRGCIKQGNQEAERIVPRFEAVGKPFAQVVPGAGSAQRCQSELQQVIDSGVALYDTLENFTIHGQHYWYRVDKVPTKNGAGEVTGVMVTFKDVTTDVSYKKALEESETRYRAFIANSSEAVFCIDMSPPVNTGLPYAEQTLAIEQSGVLVESNSVMAEMFDFQNLNDRIGTRFFKDVGHSFAGDLNDFLANNYRLQDREVITTHANSRRYYQMSIMGIVEDGQLVRIWGTARDTTERRRYLEKLEYQATHDSLTLLPNRSFLYKELEKKLRETRGKKFALMLMDLDRFKEINDTLGHHVGDELLKKSAHGLNWK
ncbi:diguanylate cyclase domain-containing protein [Candidatus Pelagadaptatus aseana]|uniref:PAS domain-containing protein n=1 Tax=Candidatus Pelagadaptatus aseana TaxID=3120508 RepID=UPI003C701E84